METNDVPAVRLLLLDDHDVARGQAVARLSRNPHLEVVGHAGDCRDALALARELEPDAVLVDTRRVDHRGLEAIAMLSSLDGKKRPAIVAYVEILHRGDWPHAKAAGADDVVLKEMPPESLSRELGRIVERVRQDAPPVGSRSGPYAPAD